MNPTNKKPGALKQPGKDKTHTKRTRITAAQEDVHRRIAAQSAHTLSQMRHWHPEEYPALWRLIQAAKAEAQARRRLKGRIVFSYEGRRYAARFSNLDRVIVEDGSTGEFIASSGIFAL